MSHWMNIHNGEVVTRLRGLEMDESWDECPDPRELLRVYKAAMVRAERWRECTIAMSDNLHSSNDPSVKIYESLLADETPCEKEGI